jgi:hypothetical protein
MPQQRGKAILGEPAEKMRKSRELLDITDKKE